MKGGHLQRIITWFCFSPSFYRALQWVSVHCSAVQLTNPLFWFLFQCSHSVIFWLQAAVSGEKALKKHLHTLFGTKEQTDTVEDQLMKIAEHLAGREPNIFSRERPKTMYNYKVYYSFIQKVFDSFLSRILIHSIISDNKHHHEKCLISNFGSHLMWNYCPPPCYERRSLWMIKYIVLLHWQTVTNHVRLVSWLDRGANGAEAWQRRWRKWF